MGAAPDGMEVTRAEAGPACFSVDYRSVRRDESAYVDLNVRSALSPAPRCPEPAQKDVSCTVDAHGGLRMVRTFPGGRAVTLSRHLGDAEAEVTSQTLANPGCGVSWTRCTRCRTPSWRS
ncbi:hypothetical protein ACIQM0_12370 [Streptomyces sp. NPDC091387]|uniref:hypothetical protein n=1 Tax=Streptomyces sp. NPDC091387 TaxID=3365998 RepID=UPI0037F4B238